MAALRRAHLAHFLIAASCSAVAPATTGAIEGVPAIDFVPCGSNQQCTIEYIQGAALAPGAVWVTRQTSTGSNQSSWNVQLERLRFDGDAGAAAVGAAIPGATESDVAVTADGATIDFLDVEQSSQAVVRQIGASGAQGSAKLTSSQVPLGPITGLVADTNAAIVGLAASPSSPNQTNQDTDVPYWLQNMSSVPAYVRSGVVARVDLQNGGVGPTRATSFVLTYTHHLMAADATNVYWIAGPSPSGEVHMSPRDLSTESQLAVIADGAAPAGLAVATGKVAWSSTSRLFGDSPACWIWLSSSLVFQSTTSWCVGLAIDDTDAYFATVEVRSFTDNNGMSQTYLAATGMARVSLAGPAQQTPHVVPITSTSDRIYGPRRILLDAQYVYGIDPAYVLRVPKAAFAP